MVNINIKIEKKDMFLIGAIAVFFVGVGIVIATNSNNPLVHGHSGNEVPIFVKLYYKYDGNIVDTPTGYTNADCSVITSVADLDHSATLGGSQQVDGFHTTVTGNGASSGWTVVCRKKFFGDSNEYSNAGGCHVLVVCMKNTI